VSASAPIQINQPIVAWRVNQPSNPALPPIVTYDRPSELEGTTYKIKPACINCAMYITINHVKLPDGSLRPLEVFINSKNTGHHQWIVALTRMISAVFRKPGPIEFAIEELEEVFDPQGGYWEAGKHLPSLVAHVGLVLRQHCEKIGVIEKRELTPEQGLNYSLCVNKNIRSKQDRGQVPVSLIKRMHNLYSNIAHAKIKLPHPLVDNNHIGFCVVKRNISWPILYGEVGIGHARKQQSTGGK